EHGERTLLVSGPNAGGKTVLLKTVGLISLMAQSGIFPPVDEETSLPVFESVLTAIGDEQSIDMDLSTFSGHVRDLKTAIESGTPRSLALLDEIGVGTDPAEGAALASAVLEHLTSLGCLTLCTTHYGELKLLYERLTGLVNGSLEFDTESMKPTFVFRKGIPGQSYGLAIARNMGLEEPVLRRAEEYMKGGSADISRYIARLEEEQKKLTRELEAVKIKSGRLDHEARRLKEERGELRERAGELERREKDLERRMAEGERIMLLEARKEVEKVISKLEREYAGPEDAEKAKKQARRTLEDKITSLDAESRTQSATEVAQSQGRERENTYRAGDRVLIRGLDLEGEVVDGPDSSGRYFVLAGRARMTLEACELIPSRKKKPAGKRASYDLSGAGIASGDAAPPDKLDLRGMRPDEVAEALERFLGDAGVAGFHRVVVVHGKGTGALRAKVAELLSGDSRVENFRSGAWNEGGTGATIVSLQDAGEA
ncbi:MAG: Smr/MutS family protein, partial [Gemmatimonadota bacterium]|nr:Smr/MutS family protein [Gemmatimonadota bacterium]